MVSRPFLAHCMSCTKRGLTHTNVWNRLSGNPSLSAPSLGASVSRLVVGSLRSAGARLNTSYSNTKEGCDVHTNEPIIAGFITQFLLRLIWQTYLLCSHHCSRCQVCVCVCVCFQLACLCLIKRFSRNLVLQISSFHILQGYPHH